MIDVEVIESLLKMFRLQKGRVVSGCNELSEIDLPRTVGVDQPHEKINFWLFYGLHSGQGCGQLLLAENSIVIGVDLKE